MSHNYLHNTWDIIFRVLSNLFALHGPDFANRSAETLAIVGHQTESGKCNSWEQEKKPVSCFWQDIAENGFADVIGDDRFEPPVWVHNEWNSEQVVGRSWRCDKCNRDDSKHCDWKYSLSLPQCYVASGCRLANWGYRDLTSVLKLKTVKYIYSLRLRHELTLIVCLLHRSGAWAAGRLLMREAFTKTEDIIEYYNIDYLGKFLENIK